MKSYRRYETHQTTNGYSQICNFKAKVQYSTKINDMKNIAAEIKYLGSTNHRGRKI